MRGRPGERLVFDTWPCAVYAIGDVHGCHSELRDLERTLAADAARLPGEKWLVMLGDYIDRGRASADVIEHLLAPPPEGFRRYCLRGNHEQMLLDFLRNPAGEPYWLDQGAANTLASYEITEPIPETGEGRSRFARLVAERIPERHLRFIEELALFVSLPGWLLVHAGVRPNVALADQDDHDLLWIRDAFLDGPGLPGTRVVHGHTPARDPSITPTRIGIDTNCYATGRLTAVRVTPDGETRLFMT